MKTKKKTDEVSTPLKTKRKKVSIKEPNTKISKTKKETKITKTKKETKTNKETKTTKITKTKKQNKTKKSTNEIDNNENNKLENSVSEPLPEPVEVSVEDVITEPVVKKKRGRKKKIKTPEEIEREKNKPKQRRGRKPKSLITNITSKNSQLLFDSNKNDNSNETIILNLKVDNDSIEENIKDKKSPIGYDVNETMFSSIDNKNNSISDENNIITENIINNDDWNLNMNKTCHWCCHSFNNNPFGIPIKYKHEKFYVYGCFCSLECASAYNFSEERNIQDIWECYNLINLFSQKINYKNIVKLAPDRLSLKMFGGKMTIDEFRDFTGSNKITNILEYPMIPISQQIEEINYDNSYNKNDYIPIDQDRVKKLEQKIKLMRTTPLLNHKNTLEHTMNIKINETN